MRPANAPSPRMRRAKTPFAQCPCTQTAIRAGALNHPHHTNPMNHSSDKYQPALIHALTPVNPFHPPQKGHQSNPYSPGATTRPAFAIHPAAVMRPIFLAQSHTISHNLTHSLAISRVSLVHLYVPFTLQRIGQRDNSYRLPAARIPLRFAQCPCTQTAIRAGAVNHSHHINHMNHSSDKCQPALVHTLTPGNPSIRRQKGHQPGPHSPAATTRAAFAIHPSAVMRPKFLTQSHTISHNLTQSHTFSRNLSCISRPSLRSLYTSKNRTKRQLLPAACSKNPTAIRPVPMHADRDPRRRRQSSPSHKSRKSQFKQMPTSPRTCAPASQPLHPPQKGHQPNPHSPPATTRAAFAIHPSAVMRPKFLAQSHTISRNLP